MKRTDIQILRGFAVISVVLFHFLPAFFPGGWIGVDVFFVISGYLMARHFSKNPKLTINSIFLFYNKRFQRIVPSLLPLVLLTVAVTYMFFIEEHYIQLVKSGLSSLAFFSNVYFWKQTGYFSNLVDTLPLIHTWSLSVEIQFYAIAPFFFISLMYYKRERLPNVFILTAVTLTIFSALMTYIKPDASFYLLPTRMWQFALGGYFFVLSLKQKRIAISYTYFAYVILVLLVFFGFSGGMHKFLLSFIATIMAGLVLIQERNIPQNMVSAVAIFFGTISYSLYLYHQPILAFTSYYNEYIANIEHFELLRLFSICVVLVLAVMNYHLIEKRFPRSGAKYLIMSWLITSLFLTFIFTTYSQHLKPNQMLNVERLKHDSQVFLKEWRFFGETKSGAIDDNRVIIVGDSLAADLAGSIRYHFKDINAVHLRLNDVCLSKWYISKDCVDSKREIKEFFQTEMDGSKIIYTVGLEPGTKFENLDMFFSNEQMKKLWVYLPPVFKHPYYVQNNWTEASGLVNFIDEEYVRLLQRTLAKSSINELKFIDTLKIHFGESKMVLDTAGQPLYFDAMHLSRTGFDKHRSIVRGILDEIYFER